MTATLNMQENIEGFELSPQQKHLWLLQSKDRSVPYRAQCTVLLEGDFEPELLMSVIEQAIHRHEILRTFFICSTGMTIPLQAIADNSIPLSDYHHLSNLNPLEQVAKIKELWDNIGQCPFNFVQGPLLYLSVVTLSADKHLLLLSIPALCSDTAGLKNLVREISCLYAAYLNGKEIDEESMQYADISQWQNELLAAEDRETGRAYWRKQNISDSDLQAVKLMIENQLHSEPGFEPRFLTVTITPDTVTQIEGLVHKYGISTDVFLLVCWQILLWRLTGHSDIIVGTAYDGRKYEELKEVIGLFAKYLPLRCHLEEKSQVSELLEQVHKLSSDAYTWQEYFSWEQIIKSTGNSIEPGFFPFCFDFDKQPAKYLVADISFSINQQYTCVDRFQVKLSCIQQDDALIAEFHYNANKFFADDIKCLAGQFQTLLESVIKNPQASIGELEILSDVDRQKLLVEFNNTKTDYPLDKCIHELFEEQAARTPDNIAVVYEGEHITYSQLNQSANQLAHYLQKLGVKQEVLVPICMERSLEMMIGVLGILKAGGAYLPVDPTYPEERLTFILEDAQSPLLLAQQRIALKLPKQEKRVVFLDTDWEFVAFESKENPISGLTPDNLAYVIYTSGSTGQPKGVLVTHHNLLHSTSARFTYYCEPPTSFLLLSSLAFDSSVACIFWTLCQGGTLVLPQQKFQQDPQEITKLIAENQVSHLLSLPSFYALILTMGEPEHLVGLRTVIVAGESCPTKLISLHSERLEQTSLYNEYGPTEATVWSSVYKCQPQKQITQVPIGSPIANTQIYILDSYLQPVPIKVPGEVYIGGAGLARGYLNRSDLTAEKFIANPNSREVGARLYKTGDLARYLPDGNIEFMDRSDRQVKIRGFRIELGEIEAVLTAHPQVRQAAVIAREENQSGNKRLVAYVTANLEPLTISELRGFLKQKLPEYMVPSVFVILDALPLTPNGKVNRHALPTADISHMSREAGFVAPRTPTEELIAAIWAEVLGFEQVGIHDNFFELGGHSLLIPQLVVRVRESFQLELSLRSLFKMPTVKELAQSIEIAQKTGASTISTTTVVEDFQAEAVLDPTIRPFTTPIKYITEPAYIFLTGATGFVGAFLLNELLQKTHADIYCLVRTPNVEEGKKRIQSSLESYLLWDESQSPRIIPVVGDLSQPLLGLSKEQFQEMAELIDVIYHNGACVHHTSPYSVLKAANVLGTQEVLRLASQIKVKPVHFISTKSVFSSVGYSGVKVVGEQDSLDDYQLPSNGYAQSKWVAEKLVTIAGDRGLPVCIYRLGRVSGHSQTGAFNPNDFLYRLIIGCTQLGSVPDVDMIEDMAPVDYISKAVVHLSKQEKSLGKAFHFVNHQPFHSSLLSNLLDSFGYPLQRISYEQWRSKLLEVAERSPEHTLYPLVPFFPLRGSEKEMSNVAVLQFDCQNTLNGLVDTSIVCPPIDEQLLCTYLSYLIRNGVLEHLEQL